MDIPAPFIQVDALYFQARESGVHYAISADSGEVIEPDFRYHLGARIKAGFDLHHDEWQLFVQFLHYHARLKEETDQGMFFPTQGLPEKGSGGYAESVSSQWRLHLGLADLSLARSWIISPVLDLQPYFGFRFAMVRHKSRIDYEGGTLFPGAEEDLFMKNKFWGFGPQMGVETVWRWFPSFGFFLRSACSLLLGEVYFHQDEETTGNREERLRFFNQYPQTRQMVEVALGLDVRHCFTGRCLELYARLAWEMYLLWGQNQQASFTSNMPGKFFANQGDLTLQGVSFGIGLAY